MSLCKLSSLEIFLIYSNVFYNIQALKFYGVSSINFAKFTYLKTLYTFHYSNYGYRDIMPAVKKNREKEKSLPVYDPTLFARYRSCIT